MAIVLTRPNRQVRPGETAGRQQQLEQLPQIQQWAADRALPQRQQRLLPPSLESAEGRAWLSSLPRGELPMFLAGEKSYDPRDLHNWGDLRELELPMFNPEDAPYIPGREPKSLSDSADLRELRLPMFLADEDPAFTGSDGQNAWQEYADDYKVPKNKTYKQEKNDSLQGNSDELKKSGDDDIIDLTDDEMTSVQKYISSDSYVLNEKLRSGVSLTAEEKQWVSALDSALEKLPVYQGEVYRSLDSSMMDADAFFEEYSFGNYVKNPAFTSCSTSVYDDTMDIQLIIQSKSGKDMRAYNPGENEVLFPRDKRFYVIRREGNTIWLKEA